MPQLLNVQHFLLPRRVAVTDMRYFTRNTFWRSLVHTHTKIHSDMTNSLQVRILIYFVKGGRIPLLSLNELGEKSQATITHGNFGNNPYSNYMNCFLVFEKSVNHRSKLKVRWSSIFFLWTFDLLLISSSRYSLNLFSHCTKKRLYVNAYHQWKNKNKGSYIFTCLRCWRIPFF